MDEDVWDTKYVVAMFRSFFITFLVIVSYFGLSIGYNYIRFGLFKITFFSSQIIFYSDSIILFLLLALYL